MQYRTLVTTTQTISLGRGLRHTYFGACRAATNFFGLQSRAGVAAAVEHECLAHRELANPTPEAELVDRRQTVTWPIAPCAL